MFVSEKPTARPSVEKHKKDLPADVQSLLALAQQNIHEDASRDRLEKGIAALEKALTRLPAQNVMPVDIQWRLAQACFFASENESDVQRKLAWIFRGEEAAEAATRERPDRVEGFYYLAILKGRRAENSGIGFAAMKLAKKVEAFGKRAVAIDPSFQDGGPYRLLAMLYAKAPPWPTSVGDIDLALEYGNKALQLSNYPMNHLVYAEVLIEDDEYEEARERLRKVLSAPKVGRWAHEGEKWRPYAKTLLMKIKAE